MFAWLAKKSNKYSLTPSHVQEPFLGNALPEEYQKIRIPPKLKIHHHLLNWNTSHKIHSAVFCPPKKKKKTEKKKKKPLRPFFFFFFFFTSNQYHQSSGV